MAQHCAQPTTGTPASARGRSCHRGTCAPSVRYVRAALRRGYPSGFGLAALHGTDRNAHRFWEYRSPQQRGRSCMRSPSRTATGRRGRRRTHAFRRPPGAPGNIGRGRLKRLFSGQISTFQTIGMGFRMLAAACHGGEAPPPADKRADLRKARLSTRDWAGNLRQGKPCFHPAGYSLLVESSRSAGRSMS